MRSGHLALAQGRSRVYVPRDESMRQAESSTRQPASAGTPCLVQAVHEAMDREPTLEAVKVDRSSRTISVATLGRPQDAGLQERVARSIRELEQSNPDQRCGLLDGVSDCATCPSPALPVRRQGLAIQQDAECTTVSRVRCPTAPRLWRWRHVPWPKLVPRQVRLPEEPGEAEEWRAQLFAAGLCGACGLAGYLVGDTPAGPVLFLLAYLFGSWFTVHEIWEGLREGTLDVHFLMLAVAIGSASIGAWGEGAMLLFLFSFSGALEHYAMGRTQREIRSLFKSAPKTAHRLDPAGLETVIAVEELQPGMRLLFRPGEQFAVDAEIAKGRTASDESNLTGEAVPVEKTVGDTVLAGTLNLWGTVEAVVLRPASQSALQKIIHLIREAQHLRAPSQRFTDKFGTAYTLLILGLTLGMFFVWWLGFGREPFVSTPDHPSAFYRSMTLLVVASPCALVLSIPSAVLAAISWAARRGVLFRGGAAVENLAEVTVVAMDKTGTLTTGELRVEHVESFPAGRESEVLQAAYSLERLSAHPLARAVTRHGKQSGAQPLDVDHFESVTGMGLQAFHAGRRVRLGRREWVSDRAPDGVAAAARPLPAGFSEVWVSWAGLTGRLVLRDDLRPQAREVVLDLQRRGLRCVVLTGDRRSTAELLRRELAVDDVRAELKPEEKVRAIQSFAEQGVKVAMVGDGVNDAPSLAVAHVGVAMGARGSDAALEQAAVVLMHDRLENFLTAFRLSQRARTVIRQNLAVSLGTVIVLVACALAGSIPLTVGVLGHEGSTVVVVLNSLRLLFGEDRSSRAPRA